MPDSATDLFDCWTDANLAIVSPKIVIIIIVIIIPLVIDRLHIIITVSSAFILVCANFFLPARSLPALAHRPLSLMKRERSVP